MSEESTIQGYNLNGLEHNEKNPYANVLSQILKEKRDAEQFLRMIAPQYLGVYVLDKETDLFRDIVGPDYFRKIVKEREGCYSKAFQIYIDEFVLEEDQLALQRTLDYKQLYDKLWAGRKVELTYRKTDGTLVSLQIAAYSTREEEKNLSLWVFSDEGIRYKKQLDMDNNAANILHSTVASGLWCIDYDENGDMAQCTWSNAFRKAMGYESVMEVPNTWEGWAGKIHPDDLPFMNQEYEKAKNDLTGKSSYDIEYRIRDRQGVYHWFRDTAHFSRRPNGTPICANGLIVRIDEKHEMNAKLKESLRKEQEQQERLTLALAAAEQSSRAKTTFLNNMSHDIRTPMNAIIGFTALAQTHIDNTELVQDYLAKISTSSTHLLSLINDILDMSRIESGCVKLDEKPVHMPDLLHDLRSMIQGLINAKQQNLFIDTQDVQNEDIVIDKLRLNQVLLNITSNAIKFTPVGGDIIIHLIEKPCSRKGYATYVFTIKDTGIGMSEEFVEHVFDTFSRERSSTVSGIQGTGLGMAITKNIVGMMGGSVTAKSQEGKGSTFTVTLNVKLANQSAKTEPIPELEGARALVIDDDIDTCRSVCKMLRNIDMRPDWTASGKEAILRAQDAAELQDEYKVYIVDYLMPDMNGIETVRRIRKVISEDVPIIVLTAYDWADYEQEAREAGVTAFVAKPIFMSELREVLTRPVGAASKPFAPVETAEYDYSGKRVLLVEDNELNREIATAILEETGMRIDCAKDGIEAVNAISAAPESTYDLVLMDIQMPRMDGYIATREIRTLANNRKANIPIVAMTANAFEEDKRKAFETGMNGHIVKPINMDQVSKVLDRIFFKGE